MILLSHDARVLKPWSLRGWAPFASHSVHSEALRWLQYWLILAGIDELVIVDFWCSCLIFLLMVVNDWLLVNLFVVDNLLKPWEGAAVGGQSTETFPCGWNKTDKKGFRWSFRATRGVWKSIYIHPSLGATCTFYQLEIGGLTCPSRVWAQCREDHTQDTLGRKTFF